MYGDFSDLRGVEHTERMEATKKKRKGPIICPVGVVSNSKGCSLLIFFLLLLLPFRIEGEKKNSPDKLRGKMTGFPLWFVSLTSASSLIFFFLVVFQTPPTTKQDLPSWSYFSCFILKISDTTE